MNFGFEGKATDTDFEYFESSDGEEQSLGLDIASQEEPLNISLCGG